MTEEEKDEQVEAEEAPVEDAPEPEAEEAPAEEAAAEETEAPAEEAPAEAAEEAPAPAPAAAANDEPAEVLSPKQARKRARATHTGEAGPERSPEDRATERQAARKAKAASRSRYRASQRAKKTEKGEATPPAEREPGVQKVRQGIVTSAKADKTITVAVQSARRHPSYEKIIRRSNSLHAHDERNEAGEGDTVRVVETRPMSKTKRWRLVEVVEKAK
jgi:small subunit ribosomal protein S17